MDRVILLALHRAAAGAVAPLALASDVVTPGVSLGAGIILHILKYVIR